MFCVANRHDRVKGVHLLYLFVNQKRLGDRSWVGQSSGLDNDAIELGNFGVKTFEGRDEIATDRTTNAAIHNFDEFFVDLLFDFRAQDLFINTHLAKFVFCGKRTRMTVNSCRNKMSVPYRSEAAKGRSRNSSTGTIGGDAPIIANLKLPVCVVVVVVIPTTMKQ